MDKPAKKVTTRKTATTKRKAPAKRKAAPAKRAPSTTTTKKKELIQRKRKKRLNVSVIEQGLLLYPPTQTTWACTCDTYNNGKAEKCWLCGNSKTDKLLWPLYEAACLKVGIEVGGNWKIVNKLQGHVMVRYGQGKWKDIDLPEGYTL